MIDKKQNLNAENFNRNLRELRERKNITLRELANMLNVSSRTIYYWETGMKKKIPTVENALKISSALGVTLDDLLS